MELLKLEKIHQGKFLSYYVASYLNKDGDVKEYEFISRNPSLNKETFGNVAPAGVGMVVFSKDKNKVLLEKEFRLATNHYVYNFPAGLIDKGETPIETSRRELKEETGVDLIKVEAVLPPSFASQGTSDEMMQIVICVAEGEIQKSCFADEEITTRWYSKEEIKDLLDQGAYMSVRTQMFLWQWVNEK